MIESKLLKKILLTVGKKRSILLKRQSLRTSLEDLNSMSDPYPAIGTHYRDPILPSTPNRGLTLVPEEVEFLRGILDTLPESLQEKVNKL